MNHIVPGRHQCQPKPEPEVSKRSQMCYRPPIGQCLTPLWSTDVQPVATPVVAHNGSTDSVFTVSLPTDLTGKLVEEASKSTGSSKSVRSILPSEGNAVCRICHSSEQSCPFSNGEPLISVCACRGSTGLYHRTCLERWLSASSKDKCEICHSPYPIERKPKDLLEYLRRPGSKLIRRHVISDFICWLILTPIAIVGTWLCISGAIRQAGTADGGDSIQAPTLIGLAAFLIVTYMVWGVVCLRYHVRIFRRWKARNFWIHIVVPTETKTRREGTNEGGADFNNNPHSDIQILVTPPRDTESDPASTVASGASQGTQYSTPWGSRTVHRSPYESPYEPGNGPVTDQTPTLILEESPMEISKL